MRIGVSSVQVSSACSTSSRVPITYCAHGIACAGTLRWSPAERLAAAHTRCQGTRSRRPTATFAGIKAVDTYDGKFDLTKESEGTLTALLSSEVFCKQAGFLVLHCFLSPRQLCSLTSGPKKREVLQLIFSCQFAGVEGDSAARWHPG